LWRSEALTGVVSKLLRPFQQVRQLSKILMAIRRASSRARCGVTIRRVVSGEHDASAARERQGSGGVFLARPAFDPFHRTEAFKAYWFVSLVL
jgi:hypothetical protein